MDVFYPVPPCALSRSAVCAIPFRRVCYPVPPCVLSRALKMPAQGGLFGVVSEFGKNRTLSRVATLVMRGVLERVDVRLTYAPTGRQVR